ncbi:MAG: sensor histidine kinase [Chloroflexota bacterium]
MFDSLRNRLILSHALPMLIVLPVMGMILIYVLETQVLLPDLSQQLSEDAALMARIIQAQPALLDDPGMARQMLSAAAPPLTKRVMLISSDDRLLASSDPADQSRENQPLRLDGLTQAKTGQVVTLTNYNQRLHGDVIDVFAPITTREGRLLGTVRATARYATVVDEFYRLRAWIGGVLLLGILLGVILGSALAVTLANPIQQATRSLSELSGGSFTSGIRAAGPYEIRLLVGTVNRLVTQLQNLESARRKLLANLVHELGRPLAALRMAVQVILQGSKDDPAQLSELLEGMDQELGQLQRLLEDLTHLYDLDIGVFELERTVFAPAPWLAAALRPWHEMARGRDLQWVFDVPADLPLVNGDPVRLAQVVGNLISNAIKVTPPGGIIAVTAGSSGDQLWIKVSDSGPGIPADELQKIFEPFYQGRTGASRDAGMGLGLSIARSLVEAHGGSIHVDSHPGAGSEFTIQLPLAHPAQI